MKTYRNLFAVVALVVFIVPQIAFAVWWNPFSWNIFHRSETKTQAQPFARVSSLSPQLAATSTKEAKTIGVKTKIIAQKPTCTVSVLPSTIIQGDTAVLSWQTAGVQPDSIAISSLEVASGRLGGGVAGVHKMIDSSVVAPSVSMKYSINTYVAGGVSPSCSTTLTVLPRSGTSGNTQNSFVNIPPIPNTTPCNGINWTACPAGQNFICPGDGGKAYCQLPQPTLSQPSFRWYVPNYVHSGPSAFDEMQAQIEKQRQTTFQRETCERLGGRFIGTPTSGTCSY